jgi:hypothetical protein
MHADSIVRSRSPIGPVKVFRMTLTAVFLTLKMLSVFVAPANPLSHDDQTLATCVVHALTERPSALMLLTTKEMADATILVENQAKFRIHVVGTVTLKDGTNLGAINHVTHGFNHSLCHQADGLLDEIARNLPAAVAFHPSAK